jgi:hypothetical protein
VSKKTGLGRDALFKPTQPEPEATPLVEQAESGAQARPQEREAAGAGMPSKKAEKIRTSVMFYPTTLAAMEMLKIERRRQGDKATYSDILEEAVLDLLAKKGLTLE